MAKYIKYNECEVSINGNKIFALNANLSADSFVDGNVEYGGNVESYKASSELSSSVSFEYYVTGQQDHIVNLTGDIPCSGSFCGVEFSGAYLSQYQINIEPYAPVTFNASFNIYSGYRSTTSTGSFSSDSLELANGAHTNLTNISSINVGLDNPQSIEYVVDCAREPCYVIGKEFPKDVRDGMVQKQISIRGENVGELINFSGKDFARIEIQPRTHNNLSRGQLITCQGVIKNQQLSVSKGGLLNGSIEIIERVK